MNLTVSRHVDGKSGLIALPVRDILYFEFDKGKEMIAFHTLTERFFIPGTLKYWTESLRASGYHFAMVDRNNAVNLCKIRHFDRSYKLAYFEDEVCKHSKSCTVSVTHLKTVLQALGNNLTGLSTI